ncbi:diaminopimelate decarboxylase [Vogesella sp. LIG4]|uniref:diaminopimelate decarboxylase n=1 Tax=Vogesella sp. LIG4 TaxID=1192162 RepID=UPI00081FD8F0|nr:diaminopimelate decarboxylase [Vogesella sp. LIG4]SCK19439.1 diaminopimelate decarboxylase [Vogesella sp. LIG4]
MYHEYDSQRQYTLQHDRRLSASGGQLAFEGVELPALAATFDTPLFVYSAPEVRRNIAEIRQAFATHGNTRICYASKACSLLAVLQVVREAGISVEANSVNEIRRCLAAGFQGSDIVYNGVAKRDEELDFAIRQQLHAINVDSEQELAAIDRISRQLQLPVRICLRVEPNVKAATHEGLITAFRAKSGVDLADAERLCRQALEMPYVRLCGLHMHVGDQVPDAEPFAAASRVLVNTARQLEATLGIRFDMINVGGGIPTPYRYASDRGAGGPDNMQPQIGASEFAQAVIREVHAWRQDIEICIEPGRKVVGSAALLLTGIVSGKHKTLLREDGSVEGQVQWRMLDAGFNVIPDYKDWYFYVYNASRVTASHCQAVKLGGPLCDGGDYFRQGPLGEQFLLPDSSASGDVLAFLDVGAYQLETQTVYNAQPRAAAVLIDDGGHCRLVRRREQFDDMLRLERDLG